MRAALCALGMALLVAIELGAPTREPFDNGAAPVRAVDTTRCGDATEEQDTTLTRPADLLLLEMPDRAIWQKPDLIMDELHIAYGSTVADVGAGSGWFTIRLSERVGQQGRVYAQDVQPEMLFAIKRRLQRKGLENVETRLGDDTSSRLPRKALDAILVVDVYAEIAAEKRVAFLKDLAESLKPLGRIGIVNYKPGAGGPGGECRFPSSVVESDAHQAALRILSPPMELRYQYVVVLGK
jgi:SAM-dependent methyltransferase